MTPDKSPTVEEREQAREQVLSCLEDVKLDLEELRQHTSAVVVSQAIEIMLADADALRRLQTENDNAAQLIDRSAVAASRAGMWELVGSLRRFLSARGTATTDPVAGRVITERPTSAGLPEPSVLSEKSGSDC